MFFPKIQILLAYLENRSYSFTTKNTVAVKKFWEQVDVFGKVLQ